MAEYDAGDCLSLKLENDLVTRGIWVISPITGSSELQGFTNGDLWIVMKKIVTGNGFMYKIHHISGAVLYSSSIWMNEVFERLDG